MLDPIAYQSCLTELVKIADEVDDAIRNLNRQGQSMVDSSNASPWVKKNLPWLRSKLDPGSRAVNRDMKRLEKTIKHRLRSADSLRRSGDMHQRDLGLRQAERLRQQELNLQAARKGLAKGYNAPKALARGGASISPNAQRLGHKALGLGAIGAGVYGGYKYLQHKRNQTMGGY